MSIELILKLKVYFPFFCNTTKVLRLISYSDLVFLRLNANAFLYISNILSTILKLLLSLESGLAYNKSNLSL